jgi:integrase
MRLPKYSRHASGKARVRYKGKDIYLPGEFGSAESLTAYERLCDHIRAEQAARSDGRSGGRTINVCTVAELCDGYTDHAQAYYRDNPAELDHLRAVTRLLTLNDARLPVDQFTPLHLEQIRQQMIDGGWKYDKGTVAKPWCRRTVNQQIRRMLRVFRWGVAKMRVRPDTLAALEALQPLRAGRTNAVESEPVEPVAWEIVAATLQHVNDTVAAMVRVQWYTGMRPGEVCRMTPTGLDVAREVTDGVWLYRPHQHKTRWRGKARIIAIGPHAIAVLKPRMPISLESPFCPTPSGRCYSTTTYRQAVQRACKRAGIEQWHPNQLRHAKGTLVEAEFGREAAANALGDTIETTEIYAERNLRQMIDIARKTG